MTRSDGPETVIDGWYIEVPGLPRRKSGAGGAVGVLTTSIGGQRPAPPRIEIKQTGPVPEGLSAWQKMTTTVVLPGGSHHNFEGVSEVTELVEGGKSACATEDMRLLAAFLLE